MSLWMVAGFIGAVCASVLVLAIIYVVQSVDRKLKEYHGGIFREAVWPRVLRSELLYGVLMLLLLAVILAAPFVLATRQEGFAYLCCFIAVLLTAFWGARAAWIWTASVTKLRPLYGIPSVRTRSGKAQMHQIAAMAQTTPMPIINIDNPNGPPVPRQPTT